jgi:phosphate starvation-inducible PhoH-like protein
MRKDKRSKPVKSRRQAEPRKTDYKTRPEKTEWAAPSKSAWNSTASTAVGVGGGGAKFHLEFLTPAQKQAWEAFQQYDVLFLTGTAGTGKSHLATAFAINEILQNRKKKIVLTRPIVEAGESLGYLPGTFEEKVCPYMMPLYDCMKKLGGDNFAQKDIINSAVEVAPLAFMRGRTFDDAVCIFDEAQNATKAQLKLFLTRFGKNTKIIITGDPAQSDLNSVDVPLVDVMFRLESLKGIGMVSFKRDSIVRHPLISDILDRLEG